MTATGVVRNAEATMPANDRTLLTAFAQTVAERGAEVGAANGAKQELELGRVRASRMRHRARIAGSMACARASTSCSCFELSEAVARGRERGGCVSRHRPPAAVLPANGLHRRTAGDPRSESTRASRSPTATGRPKPAACARGIPATSGRAPTVARSTGRSSASLARARCATRKAGTTRTTSDDPNVQTATGRTPPAGAARGYGDLIEKLYEDQR